MPANAALAELMRQQIMGLRAEMV
eukprot:SAG31_NODE_19850_length_590_cov_0.892057_1_plen_23_part_10